MPPNFWIWTILTHSLVEVCIYCSLAQYSHIGVEKRRLIIAKLIGEIFIIRLVYLPAAGRLSCGDSLPAAAKFASSCTKL